MPIHDAARDFFASVPSTLFLRLFLLIDRWIMHGPAVVVLFAHMPSMFSTLHNTHVIKSTRLSFFFRESLATRLPLWYVVNE